MVDLLPVPALSTAALSFTTEFLPFGLQYLLGQFHALSEYGSSSIPAWSAISWPASFFFHWFCWWELWYACVFLNSIMWLDASHGMCFALCSMSSGMVPVFMCCVIPGCSALSSFQSLCMSAKSWQQLSLTLGYRVLPVNFVSSGFSHGCSGNNCILCGLVKRVWFMRFPHINLLQAFPPQLSNLVWS